MTRLGDTSKIKSVNIVMGLMTICFVIVLGTEQFIFCAASIYSIFRTPMIEPRRSRTVIGMPPIERASTVLKSPLPRHAEIAIARRIPGIA